MNEALVEQAIKTVEARVTKLEEGQTALREEGRELRVVLGGDLSGKPGVLQNQLRFINALFDEKEGLVPRLTALERRELERTGFVHGAKVAWGILGAILGALAMFLLSHFVIK
jgi:hypothetical protein